MTVTRRRNNVTYSSVPKEETDGPQQVELDGFSDAQFQPLTPQFPWKTVAFVIVFLVAGSLCLSVALLIGTGYFEKTYDDRIVPLLILGLLMGIPGGYYGFVLLCICLGREGYSLDDIPRC